MAGAICSVPRRLLALAATLVWAISHASPHTPTGDSIVLEHVPAAAATQRLAPLRARVATDPGDLESAIALAQGYIDIGRTNADPRFVSYAEATLSPWLQTRHPSPVVLTLAATARQYLHHFDEALTLLDRALALDSFNGQAWLTKATILEVQGRFEPARQACRPLIQINGQLIALTCLTSVNSLTGKLTSSYNVLRSVFTDDPRLPTPMRVWILNQLADMAQRCGDDSAAERYFRAALEVNPTDGYTKGGYADLLLREHRPAEVLKLLRGDEAQDNLLLRLAIASTLLRSQQAPRLSRAFQARYEAARRDGDFTHLREQARFLLQVRAEPGHALELAKRNWDVQREPEDVRIYWMSAAAAGNSQDLQQIRGWIQKTHYEDAVLPDLAAPVALSPTGEER